MLYDASDSVVISSTVQLTQPALCLSCSGVCAKVVLYVGERRRAGELQVRLKPLLTLSCCDSPLLQQCLERSSIAYFLQTRLCTE